MDSASFSAFKFQLWIKSKSSESDYLFISIRNTPCEDQN